MDNGESIHMNNIDALITLKIPLAITCIAAIAYMISPYNPALLPLPVLLQVLIGLVGNRHYDVKHRKLLQMGGVA